MSLEIKPLLNLNKQALLALEKGNFSEFVKKIATIGEIIQKKLKIKKYRNNKTLECKLLNLDLKIETAINNKHKLGYQAFENAWRDKSLARLKKIKFTHDTGVKDNTRVKAEPDSCLLLWEESCYKIIPVSSEGEKLSAIDISKMDDVSEIIRKLPKELANKMPDLYTIEEKELVSGLKKALKCENYKDLDQTSLAAKSALDKETRRRIKLGLEAFKIINKNDFKPLIKQASQAEAYITNQGVALGYYSAKPSFKERMSFRANTYAVVKSSKQDLQVWFYKDKLSWPVDITSQVIPGKQECDKEDLAAEIYCHYLDKQAYKAIRTFKTTRQKITIAIGSIIAALTAFTYGTLEFGMAMLSFFVAMDVVWSNLWLALVGVLLIAGTVLLPIPSTWTSWKVFSTYLPEFFNKIQSEYNEINSKTKKTLFWGLSLFAFATGLAAGGLAYTSTIALPDLLGLGAIGAIFPPVGIFLAAVVAICQTCMLLRNFCSILRKQNSWKAFIKPFFKVNEALKDAKVSTGRKAITWGIVGGLIVLSVLGLAMSCFTSTRSVGKFFIDQLNTSPAKALAWGIAISGVGSFLSRLYFTLDAAINSGVIVCKRLIKNNLPALSRFKKFAITTDTVQAGGFYAQSAQSMLSQSRQTPQELSHDINFLFLSGMSTISRATLTIVAFLVASARYFAINTNHADEPEDPHKEAREQAASQRIKNIKNNYENNKSLLFLGTNKGNENSYPTPTKIITESMEGSVIKDVLSPSLM